jgi:ketosteroid isomerase-like protein
MSQENVEIDKRGVDAYNRLDGVQVNPALGMLAELRGGRISRLRTYLDHDEALKAASVAE